MRKKIRFRQDIEAKGAPGTNISLKYKGGVDYLIDADLNNALHSLFPQFIESVEDISWPRTVSVEKAKNIFIYRSGGIGDILFILPYLSTIKQQNPSCQITFWTMPNNLGVLNLSNYIDKKLSAPIELNDVIENYDMVVSFDKFIELNPVAEHINAYDLAETFLGMIKKGPMESTLTYQKVKGDKIHIGIAYAASSPVRMLSPFLLFDFLRKLNPEVFRVTLYVQPALHNDSKDFEAKVKAYNSRLELSIFVDSEIYSVAVSSVELDPITLGIGPDSGLINLWGYHGIPVLGVFGPFDSHLRLKYYKRALGIDPITPCPYGKNQNGSCFSHKLGSCELAEYKSEFHSPCIHLITGDHIMYGVEKLIGLERSNP